jgi:hypothetical protein
LIHQLLLQLPLLIGLYSRLSPKILVKLCLY